MRNFPNMIIELIEKGANSAIMLKKTEKPKISVRKKRNFAGTPRQNAIKMAA